MNKRGPVLITGAGGGIGLATTLMAARRGWSVHAAVRSASNVGDVLSACAREGLDVHVDVLDVTDAERCAEVVNRVRPFALINNAGIGSAGAIEEVDIAVGREQLEVMAVAPMLLSQLVLPHMRARGGGRIVNISSLGGRTSSPFTGWYVAAKHALEALSDTLRMEVARDNIFVTLIEPGGVKTGILSKSVASIPRENSRFARGYLRAQRFTSLTQAFQGNPQKVADVIVNALESRTPRPRYVVGADAHLLILIGKVFPTRVRDRFKRKVLSI